MIYQQSLKTKDFLTLIITKYPDPQCFGTLDLDPNLQNKNQN